MENNVSNPERWLSVVAGTALVAYGLTRRSLGGVATALLGGSIVFRGVSGHCPAYGALGISTASDKRDNVSVPYGRGIRVEESVTVSASPERLFRFWRNLENLPRFMRHLESVRVLDDRLSHWTVKGPAGTKVEWDAEIINEVPNELIAWRSIDGSQVDHAGSVHFSRVDGRTEVRVLLRYDPPAGALGATIAKLFGEEPSQQIREDLDRLEEVIDRPLASLRTEGDRAIASPS